MLVVLFSCLLLSAAPLFCWFFFFFNDTATTEIYTLSLHDALPICVRARRRARSAAARRRECARPRCRPRRSRSDRKSTRLNSSHLVISYAVFCLKKKKHKTALSHSQDNQPTLVAKSYQS